MAVTSQYADQGVTFDNNFVSYSLCCPSRASILTGNYPHNTGVFTNSTPDGGWKVFHEGAERDTIGTQLQQTGYQTGFMGKYMNGYNGNHIPPGWDAKVREFCRIMDEKVEEYEELLTHNRIWLERTRNVGVISGEDAVALGLTGPALRASGVAHDIRKDEPYAAYADFEFDVPIGVNGDTYDRYLVRMEEFRQSVRIVRQAVAGLPEGPIVGKVPRVIKPPAGETYHAIESPKGEIGYFIVADGKSVTPYRFRVRPPSFCNLQALPKLVKGHLVADVVALIGSIDIVLGEVDR